MGSLAVEGLRQRPVHRLVDQQFRGTDSERSVRGDRPGQRARLRRRAPVGHDPVDQPVVPGLVGIDGSTGEDHLLGDAVRYPPRQTQHAARGGHQTAFDLRQAERRALAGHDQVAGERDFEPTAQSWTLHGRDDRFDRRSPGDAERAPAFVYRPLTGGAVGLEVHAGTEDGARPRQHTDADVVTFVELVECYGERLGGGPVHRVAYGRPVQRDQRDAVGDFESDRAARRCRPAVRASAHRRRLALRVGAHRGAILIAPSSRMVSPLSMALSMTCSASLAYSSGSPNLLGCGTVFAKDARTSSDRRFSRGVSKVPGAIVHTRMPLPARSRAATIVMPTMPAFAEAYGICPICPSYAATDAVSTHTPRSPSTGSLRAIRAAASLSTLKVPTRLTLTTSA